jgi:hypothetical protein
MELHFAGLLVGLGTFAIIGIFHPIVIKTEYHTGTRFWWVFLLLGLGGCAGVLFVEDIAWAALLGVFAFTCLWAIGELFEQKKRVQKGWFPKNPKREYEQVGGKTADGSDREK